MEKYILFDLDGTLTDPYEGIIKSFQHTFAHFGITEDNPEKLRRLIGPPLRKSFESYGLDVEKAVTVYRERFGTVGLYGNSLYDGIQELLETLKADGPILAIASSKAEVYVKRIAEHFGIAHFFNFIGGAELDGRRSEKDEVIEYAMSEIGVQPGDKVYMIGDREHDIFGAKKFGIPSIGVLYGYGSREELETAGTEHIVEDVGALKSLLQALTA
ncbi:MAG: HAD hydrolase-like protein [Oscillospiraceae bacterium]|nr:HAD hydrolase-like protein [Oscillospiraceae bacterium]